MIYITTIICLLLLFYDNRILRIGRSCSHSPLTPTSLPLVRHGLLIHHNSYKIIYLSLTCILIYTIPTIYTSIYRFLYYAVPSVRPHPPPLHPIQDRRRHLRTPRLLHSTTGMTLFRIISLFTTLLIFHYTTLYTVSFPPPLYNRSSCLKPYSHSVS